LAEAIIAKEKRILRNLKTKIEYNCKGRMDLNKKSGSKPNITTS